MIKRITYCIIFYCSVLVASGRDYSIAEFGAEPDGKSNNSKAFQRAIDACSNDGGGTVSIPSGTWITGTVILKSNVSIYLSGGAIWKAINDTLAFPYMKTTVMSRENVRPALSMIYASNVDHVKIYGEGILDGGGDYEFFQVRNKFQLQLHHRRPYGIYMVNCSNITVEGIMMQNSAMWMQRYQNCKNLKLLNLTVFNHSNYNNDGIDIDGCEDVLVSNCNVDSSDDALCLKSEGMNKCKNVVVTNCILSSHATPLKLGTGSIGGFENIVISNILIRPSKSKEMIHELKSWRGLSGIDILSVDGGTIDGVSINNVMMDSIETPFFIKLGNRHSKFPGSKPATEGKLRNVRISNIVAKNCGSICSAVTGYPGAMVENVWLSDIYIQVEEGVYPQITAIEVPENSDGYPCNRMFGKKLPATGLYVRHAKNVSLYNFQVSLLSPDARPVIWVEDAKEIILRGVKADMPSGGGKLIVEKQSELKILD